MFQLVFGSSLAPSLAPAQTAHSVQIAAIRTSALVVLRIPVLAPLTPSAFPPVPKPDLCTFPQAASSPLAALLSISH